MTERYSRLYTLDSKLYQEGSPVIVVAGALLKDNVTGSILAQIKYRNISNDPIKAIKVAIQPLSITHTIIGEDVEHQYLDLNIPRDAEFGQKEPIILHNSTTRNFSINILEVVFKNDATWKNTNGYFKPISSPKSLAEVLDNDRELIKQYRIDYGSKANVLPIIEKDIWFCNCGAINHKAEEKCHICNANTKVLFSFDLHELEKKKVTRLNNEIYEKAEELFKTDTVQSLEEGKSLLAGLSDWKDSKEKIDVFNSRIIELKEKAQTENEQRLIEKRKTKKKWIIGFISLSAFAVIVFVLNTIVLPHMHVSRGNERLSNGDYDAAIEEFESAKEPDLVKEAKYQKAQYLMENEQYEEAKLVLEELGILTNYKQSASMRLECENAITYLDASNDFSSGNYKDAWDKYNKIKSYKDSAEILKLLHPIPSGITMYGWEVTYNYDEKGKMISADVHNIDGISWSYTCDSNGVVSSVVETVANGKEYPGRFIYKDDGIILERDDDNRKTEYFDVYGNYYNPDYEGPERLDEHHNTVNVFNKYDTYGNLTGIEYNSSPVTIDYIVIFDENDIDTDIIWKNFRLVASKFIWWAS